MGLALGVRCFERVMEYDTLANQIVLDPDPKFAASNL